MPQGWDFWCVRLLRIFFSYVNGCKKRSWKISGIFPCACNEKDNMRVLDAAKSWSTSWYTLCNLIRMRGELSLLLPEALGVPGICPKKLAADVKVLSPSDYLRSKTVEQLSMRDGVTQASEALRHVRLCMAADLCAENRVKRASTFFQSIERWTEANQLRFVWRRRVSDIWVSQLRCGAIFIFLKKEM